MSDEISRRVRWMERKEIETVLENYGFACYYSETTEKLEEALIRAVEDGDIPKWELSG
jgi:hypothetical protein